MGGTVRSGASGGPRVADAFTACASAATSVSSAFRAAAASFSASFSAALLDGLAPLPGAAPRAPDDAAADDAADALELRPPAPTPATPTKTAKRGRQAAAMRRWRAMLRGSRAPPDAGDGSEDGSELA